MSSFNKHGDDGSAVSSTDADAANPVASGSKRRLVTTLLASLAVVSAVLLLVASTMAGNDESRRNISSTLRSSSSISSRELYSSYSNTYNSGYGSNDVHYTQYDDEWYYDGSEWHNDPHTDQPSDYETNVPTKDLYDESSTLYPTEEVTIPYKYEYKPVQADLIVPTNGGYGGRSGRSIVDVRFNKCPPVTAGHESNSWRYAHSRDYMQGVHKSVFPLLPSDYPMSTATKGNMVKRETMADSVVTMEDYQLFGANPQFWMALVKAPWYPSGDAHAPYWEQLRHVARVQEARRRGDDPASISRWPDLWSEFSLEDIANAVKGEYPGSLQQQLIMQMFANGGVEMDKSMNQFRSVVDFVGTELRIAALNTWAVEAVGPINFMLKWHVGMPRPEEMAWLIASGEFGVNDGVPQDLVDALQGMGLTHAAEFTAYMDGSPMHPSWPAMHAAGSVCSYWIPAVAKITPEQYCEALRVDYAVAYARTVAGVHYPMDNFAGLNIGLNIIKDKLPAHLADYYGYDEGMVRGKLEALAFDWETFDPYECTIAGVPVGDRLIYPKDEEGIDVGK